MAHAPPPKRRIWGGWRRLGRNGRYGVTGNPGGAAASTGRAGTITGATGFSGSLENPKEPEAAEITLGGMLKRLFREFWPSHSIMLQLRVFLALALLVAAKVLNVQVPVIFKHTIDQLGEVAGKGLQMGDAMSLIPLTLLLAYGGVRVMASVFNELRSILFAKVCANGLRQISQTTLQKLLGMDYNFHTNRQSGALSKAIDRGHRSIDFALRATIFTILPTALEVLLVGNLLFDKCGPAFMALTLATMGIYFAFTVTMTQWRTKFYKKTNELENQASSSAFDSLLNFETVKYFGNERLELQRYDNILKDYQKSYLQSTTSLGFLNFGQTLIFSAGLTAALILSAQSIVAGTSTLGDIVMIQTLLMQLSLPLGWLGSLYRELRQAAVDMNTIFQLRDSVSTINEPTNAPNLNVSDGKIEYQDISFGYNSSRTIIDQANLEIPGGSRVALVGSTGSGKSSALRLLFRFYDPWKGKVLIDGQDISKVSLRSLREAIGVVPQDVVLFNDDIMYNIKYGNPEASDEEAIAAARAAKIHDSIMRMPDGYQTVVGERGLKLSGGEKQRLAIARLLLKKPQIVVFDEATSSLDMQTEREIMNSLDKATKGCTTLLVAHRLETVKDADQIYVFDAGRITQSGTHAELIQDPEGLYSKMWAAQQEQELPSDEDVGDAGKLAAPADRQRQVVAAADGRGQTEKRSASSATATGKASTSRC